MSEFKTYTIEQLCIVGSSKRVHLSDYVQQGVPFYRSKEVIELSSGKNISEQLFISPEKYSEIKSKFPVPQENDVLITAVGTIGEILVVKDPNFYFKDGNLIWLRNINFDIIDIDYLYYFLKSDLFQKTIKYNNIGAVQKALTIDFLKTVKITLPSLDNQRKLISVLKSIDKKLKINNKINQELEVMAKTLYDYWFVQFDFPDQNGKPYKSSGGKMVYNPELKREIPDGWGVEKLKDFSQYVSEKVDSSELNIENYVGTDNMIADMGGIELTTSIPKSGTSTKFSVGDILISNIRPYFKKIWLSDRIGGCSADVLCIRTKKIISKEFVYATLARDDFFNYDIAGSKGSKMPRGDKKHIMEYPIVFELGIVEQYSKIVRPIYEAVHENNNQNQELTRLRDWLLPMLMNGQVYKRIEGKND